jgi:hypothetical protein
VCAWIPPSCNLLRKFILSYKIMYQQIRKNNVYVTIGTSIHVNFSMSKRYGKIISVIKNTLNSLKSILDNNVDSLEPYSEFFNIQLQTIIYNILTPSCVTCTTLIYFIPLYIHCLFKYKYDSYLS